MSIKLKEGLLLFLVITFSICGAIFANYALATLGEPRALWLMNLLGLM